MRKIHLENIEIGTKLARSIYNSKRQMLLREGTLLTVNFIKRLKILGYTSVYVNDGLVDDVRFDEVVSEKTRLQAISCLNDICKNIGANNGFSVVGAKQVVSDIISELLNNRQILLNLSEIRSYDDYTFGHSVNVTVISTMIGMSLNYTQKKLHDLALAVLLHDIGKTKIPPRIINKPGKLTQEEFEIIKKHTWEGFEILRSSPEIKITSAHVALQHHERCDGSGYPRNLDGDNILEFARVSAIADVFDALTNDRCYQEKIPAHKAYNIILENSGTHFDKKLFSKFSKKIALYPQGSKVLLNDGRAGLVIRQNSSLPTCPVVRIFWELGKELSHPEEVNLLDEPGLAIVEVLES